MLFWVLGDKPRNFISPLISIPHPGQIQMQAYASKTVFEPGQKPFRCHWWCFIDEIDALQDQALISVLRQLRNGFPTRPQSFPQSVGLIGLRDVRDYKVASGGSDRLNTASPFNIKVRSLTLRNFNAPEVAELYRQHTAETGQVFTDAAVQTAFDLTQGQPWLVNALAKEVVEELIEDPTIAITPDPIHQPKKSSFSARIPILIAWLNA